MFKFLIKPQALAEISRNIAEVFFAMLFLSSIIGVQRNIYIAVLGLVLAITFWLISLYLEK